METMRLVIGLLSCFGVAHAEGKQCVVAQPVALAPAKVKAPPCHRAPKKIENSIAAEITKAYMPEQGGNPEVKLPCDGLGSKIHEIVIETGGGLPRRVQVTHEGNPVHSADFVHSVRASSTSSASRFGRFSLPPVS